MKQEYILDNAWTQARERLRLLEGNRDPGSIERLKAVGVGEGWHCLEIGAGGGSIAEWLCRKVGASGRVVATDIDTRFLEALDYPNLEVRRHDITTDELPEATFDLVFARNVLGHLADRDAALRRMVGVLKSGGWLLVEVVDSASEQADPRSPGADLFAKVIAVNRQAQARAGADFEYGRRLYADARAAGLVDVDAAGRVPMVRGSTPAARFWQLTFTQWRDRIMSEGRLTEEEMDQFLALHDDPDFVFMGLMIMAVWGRKP